MLMGLVLLLVGLRLSLWYAVSLVFGCVLFWLVVDVYRLLFWLVVTRLSYMMCLVITGCLLLVWLCCLSLAVGCSLCWWFCSLVVAVLGLIVFVWLS